MNVSAAIPMNFCSKKNTANDRRVSDNGASFSFCFMNIIETNAAYTNYVTKFKPMVYPFNISDNPVFVAKYF